MAVCAPLSGLRSQTVSNTSPLKQPMDNCQCLGRPVGMRMEDLFATCQHKFLVSSMLTLRGHIVEFKDHQLVQNRYVDPLTPHSNHNTGMTVQHLPRKRVL